MTMAAAMLGINAGLTAEDFRRIARKGFGDGLNSYAHSMAWFNNHLLVGTTRATLCMIHVNNPNVFRIWPTECPDDIDRLDRRAQIWRYSPKCDSWQQVYCAPLVKGQGGGKVARDIGYRGMAVFQGTSDPKPALYVCGWSPARAERPPVLLRSYDGVEFEVACRPHENDKLNTYRTLFSFGGNLYTAPTGRTSGYRNGVFMGSQCNAPGTAVLFATPDPATQPWRVVNDEGFGDSSNLTIFEAVPFNRHLYAGTLNPKSGFQLWKTRAEGLPPYRWKPVITDGAYRGKLNECATSMCVFNDALYIGTGIQNGGYDKEHKVGPAAAELIRVYPDDTWDLIVGTKRSTPEGFKTPLSQFGPGFDDFFNAYIWRMAVHDGWLYAGTYKWTTFLPYLPREKWPEQSRLELEEIGISRIIDNDAGFDVWRSCDGVNWQPVTLDGFGNSYNYGARTMASTPYGLFIATANPFGPEIAIKNGKGWEYHANEKGGLEVWLGCKLPNGRRPVHRTKELNSRYDENMTHPVVADFFEGSDFYNFGWWDRNTRSPKQASENLMERLLAFLPDRTGSILDVACGKGATTRYLGRYFKPEHVTAINISDTQLEIARRNAPRSRFQRMDATDLRFPDESFDYVICVEACFHFETRDAFLREAYRVLKPGGRLVLSDILMSRLVTFNSPVLTPANWVPNVPVYRQIYEQIGYAAIKIVEATERCWEPFHRHCLRYLRHRFENADIESEDYRRFMEWLAVMENNLLTYVLVCAVKPDVERLR